MSLDDAAVDAGTDAVRVRIEPLAIRRAGGAVLLGHAGRERIVGDADPVAAIEIAAGVGRCGRHEARGAARELEGDQESSPRSAKSSGNQHNEWVRNVL